MNIKSRRVQLSTLVLIVAVLGYVFGWSNLLEVRTINVTGLKDSQTLTKKKVIKKSGIAIGDKLARVNSGSVARSLQEFPEIARVEINRRPLHTIEIVVQLRSIDLAFRTSGGKYALGDFSGKTFIEVAQAPRGVPIITGDRRFLDEGVAIYQALPEKLRKKVQSVALPSRASITLTLRGGLTILWGSTAEREAKLTVLAALLAAPENSRARFIDIATPLTPTVR